MGCYYHNDVEAVGTCINCGKAICQACAVDVSGRLTCKQCLAAGSVLRRQQQVNTVPGKPTNVLAIISLILGVLGLCGGLPFSIAAWVTGYLAIKQIIQNPDQEGIQFANVGKWMGIVLTTLFGIFIVFSIILNGGVFIVSVLSSLISSITQN